MLGVFFVGVGLGLDLDAIAADPVGVFGLALALTVVKTGVIFSLARFWGLGARPALETALVLAPAGEFALVVFATGLVEGLAPPQLTNTVALSATVSIFSIPLLAMLGQRLARKTAPDGERLPDLPPEAMDGAVIIVGFGRVGRLIGEMLKEHDQTFIALDTDPGIVSAGRRDGFDVFYGDAGRREMLQHCGVHSTRALIVTMDAPTKVDEVVTAARSMREDLILIARARDDQHAMRLYGLGVTDAVPETTEASLQLAENTLVDLGVPMGLVLASIHERRDQFRKAFQAATPIERRNRPSRALRQTVRPARVDPNQD